MQTVTLSCFTVHAGAVRRADTTAPTISWLNNRAASNKQLIVCCFFVFFYRNKFMHKSKGKQKSSYIII